MAARRFDLVVVGAGIYGAIAAWDATLRGLSVAIIDRGDFGCGTSSNSAKTIHSGVRALQSGNVTALRRFMRERRILSRALPHLIRPLPFVIPTYRGLVRNRTIARLYFGMVDLLVKDLSERPDASGDLPSSRVLSRAECLRLNPIIDPDGVTGGIEWRESQMYNSDRVHFSFVASAARAGAVAANYVEATAALGRGGVVEGIQAFDRITGERLDIRARVVLNAAGPWAPALGGRLTSRAGGRLPGRLSKAMNLVVASPLSGAHAVAGPVGGRLLFVAPWREYAIVGTSHDPYADGADDLALDRRELDAFVAAVNAAFPGLVLRVGDVRLVHRGLLPASSYGSGVRLRTTSKVVDHRREGVCGLISMLGVRYTTARDTAERAVDVAVDQVARVTAPCRTAAVPLVGGGDIPDFEAFLRDATADTSGAVSTQTRERLARTYGTEYAIVLDRLAADAEDRKPLGATCAVTVGEVRHAVRHEMAVRLSDALLRRTEAGSAGQPGEDALQKAAGIMAEELDWTPRRMETELAEVRRTYQLPE